VRPSFCHEVSTAFVALLAVLLAVGCGGGGASKGAKGGAGLVDDVPVTIPQGAGAAGSGAAGEISGAAARAESELDAGLASLPSEDARQAKDAICVGIDLYYSAADWDSVAQQFEPFGLQVRNLGRRIAEIVATSESDREAFLRSACAVPHP
jgi:hypothetical protein